MTDQNSQPGRSYSSIVRPKILEVIAKQAISGAAWREVCAAPMTANNITPEEVEKEIQRLKSTESTTQSDIVPCARCTQEATVNEILCKRCHSLFRSGRLKLQKLIVLESQTDSYDSWTFFYKLEEEVKRHKYYNHPLSVCIIAVDRVVEMIRLQYWTDYEAAVKAIVGVLKECLCDTDVVSYDGAFTAAFNVLLPETDTAKACTIVEKFLLKLNSQKNAPGKHNFIATATVGIASFPAHAEENISALAFLTSAEQAYSQAVSRGGNQTCIAPWPPCFEP